MLLPYMSHQQKLLILLAGRFMLKKTLHSILPAFILTLLLPSIMIGASKDIRNELILTTARAGWPPFIIPADRYGDARGIMIDILREAAQCAGRSLKIVHYPEKRCLMNLRDGTVDIYPKAREWVTKPDQFDWTAPVICSEDTLVFRNDDQARVTQSLTGMSIGVVHGFSYPALKTLFACGSIQRHDAHNTKNLLLMLSRGHVDAIFTNRHVAKWIIRKSPNLNEEEFAFAQKPLDSAPFRFAFTKKRNHYKFIAAFNKELEKMRKDGRLQAILDRYK